MLDDAGEKSAVSCLAWKHLAEPGTRKAVNVMPRNEAHPELAECFQLPEALRLLWEGMQKALEEWGLDRSDLASLCDVVVRLADHRLLVIQAKGSPPGSETIADQVRHYRKLASDLYRWAVASPPEPDWGQVAEKLRSVGADPLDTPALSKE
jgi:hypothetical protein